jgi:phospholipid/cholesterol/gamma-HCH transport system substrate-binding protein
MSNEVKIGILAIVAIAVSFWGYKFIMGKNVLQKSNTYAVYYPHVGRMQVGTVVYINGVDVGSVAAVQLMDDEQRTVKVLLDLEPGMQIPKDAVAVIESTGFMGGKAVMLEYDQPCSGDDCAQPGDTIEGEFRDLLGSMVGEEAMNNYMGIVEKGLKDVIDTLNQALLAEDADTPLSRSMQNLESTLANLKTTSAQLDALLRASSGNIQGTLSNVDAISANLKKNNDKITSILGNVDSLTGQLSRAELEKTLDEVNASIASLQQTLKTADEALAGVSGVVDKLQRGEGTLGKLLNDEKLYNKISTLSSNTDSLVNDIQERPYRYLPLKSRRRVNRYDKQDAEEN